MTPPSDSPNDPEQLAARLVGLEIELIRRAPESDIEPTLDRVEAVLELLGAPQRSFPSIHVAGTNGKSSTTRMIDSLLASFGLRTGRFTSPHLETVRERIALDGEPISEGQLLTAWDEIAPYLTLVEQDGGRSLTFFEVLTVLAFVAFADAPVAVAAVEVGLGGTWDATNVVEAPVGVVMPIDLDHVDWLGHDIESIAQEKAGIIKQGMLAVIALQQPAAMQVLLDRCAEVGATVAREGVEFGVLEHRIALGGQLLKLRGLGGEYEEIYVPLHGVHQAHNAACALAAVEGFLGGGSGRLDADLVREGFANVAVPGRLEIVRRGPAVVVDVAHNPAGAKALAAAVVDSFDFSQMVGVVGVLDDKDAAGILAALEPLLSEVVITASTSMRALQPDRLAELAVDIFGDDRVMVEPLLPNALERAITAAEADGDLGGAAVLVTGSVTIVAEARKLLKA
ncbi:MAG TPA: folylpolyglutamate synthase/dihydrofolate synthase family protein [Actinomycetes bacterium]|nr:folylpolyglutamate synthase/dihydrofolate synthase family protein [Actinomycetes bacterium]